MASEVQRYDLEQGGGWDSGGAFMNETVDGDWVHAEDYAALEARLGEGQKHIAHLLCEAEAAYTRMRGIVDSLVTASQGCSCMDASDTCCPVAIARVALAPSAALADALEHKAERLEKEEPKP